MQTKPWAMAAIIICTIFTSSAAILNKKGATLLNFESFPALIHSIIYNPALLLGVCSLGIGSALLILALKGGKVSVIYPVIATSYIWVTILSIYFFHEHITLLKIVGISFIVGGVILINFNYKSGNIVSLSTPLKTKSTTAIQRNVSSKNSKKHTKIKRGSL